MKFKCTKKRCLHIFHSCEDSVIIKCPCCGTEIINSYKLINKDNFLYIEAMLKNIQTYGKEQTLRMIDKHYNKAETRIRVRQMYYDTVKLLEKEKI